MLECETNELNDKPNTTLSYWGIAAKEINAARSNGVGVTPLVSGRVCRLLQACNSVIWRDDFVCKVVAHNSIVLIWEPVDPNAPDDSWSFGVSLDGKDSRKLEIEEIRCGDREVYTLREYSTLEVADLLVSFYESWLQSQCRPLPIPRIMRPGQRSQPEERLTIWWRAWFWITEKIRPR